jgi:hypothetical protein
MESLRDAVVVRRRDEWLTTFVAAWLWEPDGEPFAYERFVHRATDDWLYKQR